MFKRKRHIWPSLSGYPVSRITHFGTCLFRISFGLLWCALWMRTHALPLCHTSVFENTYVKFFSDFKKTWLFTFFLQWRTKKSSKVVSNPSKWVQILHPVITVIQFPAPGVWSILSHCWTFWFITHTSQLHSFLCPHFWARCLMLVTYRYWLSVIVACETIRRFFLRLRLVEGWFGADTVHVDGVWVGGAIMVFRKMVEPRDKKCREGRVAL